MKLASYNVNGVNGRLETLLRWLEQAQPDVVCLQELKAPQDRFPRARLEKAGYGAIWHGQKSWNGVAILAKGSDPVETRRALPGSAEDEESRYIEGAVDGVLIGCLYAPNGNPVTGPKFKRKLDWLSRFEAHAGELIGMNVPVALMGDYNIIPQAIDVYRPERWHDDALFRDEVRASYKRLLHQGWQDGLRVLYPDERIYTFWDYLRNAWARDAGLRIDHALLSPSLSRRLLSGGVDRGVRSWPHASDHAPLWVELSSPSAH